MKTTIKEITPEWAATVLEKQNPKNRKISDQYVNKVARDIQNNSYLLTHQAIAFDTTGALIDGQHRLKAVVLANKSITTLVVTDVPERAKVNGTSVNTFSVIDTGRARKVGQMLQMEHYKNANKIAASARVLAQICSETPDRFLSVSTPVAKLVLHAMTGNIEECTAIACGGKILKANTATVAAISFWATTQKSEAESFLVELVDITGQKNSKSRQLASWVAKHPQSGGVSATYHFQAAASAIHQHVLGKESGRIFSSEQSTNWLLSTNKKLAQKIASYVPNYGADPK